MIEVSSQEVYEYELMSYKGDVVLRGNVNQKAKVNIEHIASGFYVLRLYNNQLFYHYSV